MATDKIYKITFTWAYSAKPSAHFGNFFMTSSKPFIAAWICEELFPVYAWRYYFKNQNRSVKSRTQKPIEC